jgi:hypothetical protein
MSDLQPLMAEYPYAVAISAANGQNLDALLATLDRLLRERMVPMDLLIPYTHGELVNLAHTHGFIEEVEHLENGTHIRGRIPLELAGRYTGYWYNLPQSGHIVDSSSTNAAAQLDVEAYVEPDLSLAYDAGLEDLPGYDDEEEGEEEADDFNDEVDA